jgi:septum site-determining protein MinD
MSRRKGAAAPHAKSQKQSDLIERAKLAARQPERRQPQTVKDAEEKEEKDAQSEASCAEDEARKTVTAEAPKAETAEAEAPVCPDAAKERREPLSAAAAPEPAAEEAVNEGSLAESSPKEGPCGDKTMEKLSAAASTQAETEMPKRELGEMAFPSERDRRKKESQRRNPPMVGRAIVVTSGKGGVGKTTTTANLSMALAKLGKKVVVVDGDTGLRSLDLIMGLENRIVYNLVDVIEGACELKKALIRDKRVDGLYLLPTAQTREKDCVNEEQMKHLSDELRKDFDFVIFDCPAGIEAGFRNASAGADEALVVTTPDVSPVRDADRIIGMLESQGKKQIHLIINRMRPKMMRSGDMLGVDDVLDILSVSLIGVVPEDDAVVKSSNKGEPLTLDPGCPAATAFMNIARRITGEEVPFMDIEHMGGGFLAKLGALFGRK